MADLVACGKIVFYRLFKGRTQLLDGLGVEADDVFYTRDVSDEATVFIAVLYSGCVSL